MQHMLRQSAVSPGNINDKVLATFSRIVDSGVRVGGNVVRWGNDEDRAYLLRVVSEKSAAALFDRVLDRTTPDARPHVRLVSQLWRDAWAAPARAR